MFFHEINKSAIFFQSISECLKNHKKMFSQNEILPKTIGMWWSPEKYNLQTKMLMREITWDSKASQRFSLN